MIAKLISKKFYSPFYKSNIVAFALFFLCTFQANAQCNITLKGKIVDKENGRPLQFSTIQDKKGSFEAVADKDGLFEIMGICPGVYSIHFKHLICEHLDLEIEILNDTFILVQLPHVNHNLTTVVVHGEKSNLEISNQRLSRNNIEQLQGKTMGMMLTELNGVSGLNTGGTVSKPMINGLYGYRTLIINNGVRQEGQNWGQEHAPEIDPLIAKDIELLKGASTLRYGFEALGGVILVNPASIFNYRKDSLAGSFHAASQSNGRMGLIAGQIGSRFFTKIPVYWRLQGSVRNQGNLKSPNYYIDNTGYREQNYSWTVGTHYKNLTSDIFYSRFNTQFGIYTGAHIGNITDLNNAISGINPPIDKGFSYNLGNPRQEALHELFKARVFYKLGQHQYLKVIAARQFNQRQEFDLHLSSGIGPDFDYKITTHTLDLIWEMEGEKEWLHQLGINTIQQANTFRGRFFIPNFENRGAGAFYYVKKETGKWIWSGSARADVRDIKAYYFVNPDSLASPERFFAGIAAAISSEYHLNEKSNLSLNLIRNWRNPMPNELYSEGIHHGAASFEEGNSALKKEHSHKVELEWNYSEKENFSFSVLAFAQLVNDFINLIPASEPKQTIRGAFPYFYYDQTDALLRGINFNVFGKILKNYFAEGKGQFLWADDISRNTVLPQMPPFSFQARTGYLTKKLTVALSCKYVWEQFRFEQGTDFAQPPKGYFLLGGDVNYNTLWKRYPIIFFVRGENLTNQNYREYLDRFRYFTNRPGINISGGITVQF